MTHNREGSSEERSNHRGRIKPPRRILIIVASCISIAFGISSLALGHIISGVFLALLGSVALVSAMRQSSGERTGGKMGTSLQLLKAYSFFGLSALGGVALLTLAVAGVVREPVVYGALGLIMAGTAIYVLIRGMMHRGR